MVLPRMLSSIWTIGIVHDIQTIQLLPWPLARDLAGTESAGPWGGQSGAVGRDPGVPGWTQPASEQNRGTTIDKW